MHYRGSSLILCALWRLVYHAVLNSPILHVCIPISERHKAAARPCCLHTAGSNILNRWLVKSNCRSISKPLPDE